MCQKGSMLGNRELLFYTKHLHHAREYADYFTDMNTFDTRTL